MAAVLDRVERHGDLYAGVLTTRQSLSKALAPLRCGVAVWELRGTQAARASSVRAPALSSMSFRLPHFGLWTHDGQPSWHGQVAIIPAVSATQPSNCSKPRSAIPTPPAWPS